VENQDLVPFRVIVRETDLFLRAAVNLRDETRALVVKYRRALEDYIGQDPRFLTSLKPLPVPPDAHPIVKDMARAARKSGVGPMAAVAGAIAEAVGRELLSLSPEIIIENGGDIYLKSLKKRVIGIYAGGSPLTGKIGLEISGEDTPLGICTSSGTVGHSLSFGQADAVVVLAPSTALADAAATAIGNVVVMPEDINQGIKKAQKIRGLKGVVIIKDEYLGIWGDVTLCPTAAPGKL